MKKLLCCSASQVLRVRLKQACVKAEWLILFSLSCDLLSRRDELIALGCFFPPKTSLYISSLYLPVALLKCFIKQSGLQPNEPVKNLQ